MARQHRRIRTEPKPGVDPTPQQFPASAGAPETIRATLAEEDRPGAWGDAVVPEEDDLIVLDDAAESNDERLREDVPPHNV